VKVSTGATTFLTTAKPAYFKAIYGMASVPRELQSSILLTMALEQSRASVPAHNIEQLVGSRFIGTNGNFRYVVDAWGKPLQFFVFPAYPAYPSDNIPRSPSTDDLNIVRTTTPFDPIKERRDPQDPEGLLLAPTLGTWISPAAPVGGKTLFEMLLHPQIFQQPLSAPFGPTIPVPSPPGVGQVINRRMDAIIASAGVDGDIGGDFGDPPTNYFKWMHLPNPGSYDNIYSYRLRQTGARGD
jgi:hypothetical protein